MSKSTSRKPSNKGNIIQNNIIDSINDIINGFGEVIGEIVTGKSSYKDLKSLRGQLSKPIIDKAKLSCDFYVKAINGDLTVKIGGSADTNLKNINNNLALLTKLILFNKNSKEKNKNGKNETIDISINGLDEKTITALAKLIDKSENKKSGFKGKLIKNSILSSNLFGIFNTLKELSKFNIGEILNSILVLDNLFSDEKLYGVPLIPIVFNKIEKFSSKYSAEQLKKVNSTLTALNNIGNALIKLTFSNSDITKVMVTLDFLSNDFIEHINTLLKGLTSNDILTAIDKLGPLSKKNNNGSFEITSKIIGIVYDFKKITESLTDSLGYTLMSFASIKLLIKLLPQLNILTKLYKQLNNDLIKTITDKQTEKETKKALEKTDAKKATTIEGKRNGNIASLIIATMGVMLLGVFAGKLISSHLKEIFVFTLTLNVFIFSIVSTYSIASRFASKSIVVSNDINRLITLSTILMLTGAMAFMMQPELMKWCFVFTIMLSTFVFSILSTFSIAGLLLKSGLDTLVNSVQKLVSKSAMIMLIGALIFMLQPELMKWCFVFTIMLSTFIGAIITIYLLAGTFMKLGLDTLANSVQKLVLTSAIIMLIGALVFMMQPELMEWCFVFTIMLGIFIFSVSSAYFASSRFIRHAIGDAKRLSILIAISAATMLIGGLILYEKPGLFFSSIGFALALVVFVGLIGVAFKLLNKFNSEIRKGSVTVLILSAAIASLGIAFGIVDLAIGLNPAETLLKVTTMAIATAALAALFSGLGLFIAPIGLGSIAATTMGVGISILGIGFGIANVVATLYNTEANMKTLYEDILVSIGVFTLLGFLSILIIPGSIAAVGMGLGFLAIGTAYGVVNWIISMGDLSNDLLTLNGYIILTGGIFSLLGLLSSFIVKGSIAAVILSGAFILIGGAFKIVDVIVRSSELVGDMETLQEALFSTEHASVASIMGTVLGGVFLWIRAADASIMLTGAIINLSISIYTMVGAIKQIDKVSFSKFDELAKPGGNNIFDRFFGIISNSIYYKDSNKLDELKAFLFKFRCASHMMGSIISDIGQSVGDMAQLKIPTKWNAFGKAIDYRSLNESDFINAANGVQKIITTIGGALINLYNGKGDFKDLTKEDIKSMFEYTYLGLGDSPFTKVCKSSKAIGELISSIADGVGRMANFSIPIEWDGKGNPIKFRTLKQKDFIAAGNGVEQIITTIGGALIKTYKDNPNLFNDGKNSEFNKIVKSVSGLGELIGNISNGVAAYATSMIPIRWDENGKPIEFKQMTTATYTAAGNAIKSIIELLGASIMLTYKEHEDWFNDPIMAFGFKLGSKKTDAKDTPFARVVNTLSTLGSLVKNISEGVIAYATGTIPVDWDKEGKPINFKNIGPTDYINAAASIQGILSVLSLSIIGLYESKPNLFAISKNGKSPFEVITTSLSKIGGIIKNTADGVIAYASGRIPVYNSTNKKIIRYDKIGKPECETAAKNIGIVLSALGNSIINWANLPTTQAVIKNGVLDKAINISTKIANVIKTVTDGIMAYYKMSIPVYKNGKIDTYKDLPEDWTTQVPANIKSFLNTTGEALDEVINNDTHKAWLNEAHWDPIISAATSINKVISTVADTIVKVFNMEYVDYDSNGKESKRKITLDMLSGDNGVGEKIKKMIKAITDPFDTESDIMKLLNNYKNQISDDNSPFKSINVIITDINAIMSNIGNIISSFESNKIPSIIDPKTGEVKKWQRISSIKDYTNIQSKISNYINIIPSIIKAIIGDNAKNNENGLGNLNILSLQNALSDINNSTPIISGILSAVNDIVSEFTENKIVEEYYQLITGKLAQHLVTEDDKKASLSLLISTIVSDIVEVQKNIKSLSSSDSEQQNINDILNNVSNLSTIINILIDACKNANDVKENNFNAMTTGLASLNSELKNIDVKSLNIFIKETNALDRFVTKVNSLDIYKMNSIIKLSDSLNKLTTKFGNLDTLTTAITKNLTETLDNLSNKIVIAKETIDKTEKIQKTRHEKIKESIAAMKEIMNTKLNVTVRKEETQNNSLGDNGSSAGSETATNSSNSSYTQVSQQQYNEQNTQHGLTAADVKRAVIEALSMTKKHK